MKTEINAHLTFNGTAREAMTFYRDVLGGELSIMAIADSPAMDAQFRNGQEITLKKK